MERAEIGISSQALSMLLGLGWDLIAHFRDPHLAEAEGALTLANPGHALLAFGGWLALLGALLFLVGRAADWREHGFVGRLGVIAPVALLLVLGGLTSLVALAARTTAVHEHGNAVMITQQELAAATKLASDVQTGTRRLADIGVAQAEGYRQITAGMAGMAHYYNPAYARAGRVLDAERPETLVYLPDRAGVKELVGVMFLMPAGKAGPRVGGPLTAWHAHEGLCYSATTGMLIVVAGRDGSCPEGAIRQAKTGEMLHVWLVDNPNGVFADRLALGQVLKTAWRRPTNAMGK